MSRKITLNSFLIFEPDKKRIIGRIEPVTISASASLCLELLIENVGQLVTHQQFYDYVWRRFGSEPATSTLYQNISVLRHALNKAGLQENIIRTMPRKGFLLSPQTTVLIENTASPAPLSSLPEGVHSVNEGENENPEQGITEENLRTSQNEYNTDAKNTHPLSLFSIKHRFFGACFWSKKFVALTLFIILTALLFSFFHIRSARSSDDALFTYSADYKGCTLFSNTDALMSKIEVIKMAKQLGIDCKTTPYVYLTAYTDADRSSYFTCQNPLNNGVKANCHSFYYIKDFNNE